MIILNHLLIWILRPLYLVFGSISRHQIGRIAHNKIKSNQSQRSYLSYWHTAAINISGSFLLGIIVGFPSSISPNESKKPSPSMNSTMDGKPISRVERSAESFHFSPRMRLLFGTGFCGSFTTFSTFSVDVVNLMMKGSNMKALSYICVNNVGGFAAALSGFVLVQKLVRR